MRTDDRDDLVGDVADALTLDQQVQWERCARLAAGADRAQIENLRVIERVLASRPVAGPAADGWRTGHRHRENAESAVGAFANRQFAAFPAFWSSLPFPVTPRRARPARIWPPSSARRRPP